jgi:hypothetical protein
MNCEKFQTMVDGLAREQSGQEARLLSGELEMLLEDNDRVAALQHAAECRSCGVKLDEESGLTSNLRLLAQGMNATAASPQVEEKLLAAFRERRQAPVVVPFPVRRDQTRYWAAAIAAALLVVFGIFIVRGFVSNRPEPRVAEVNPKPKEAPKPKESVANDTASQQQPRDTLAIAGPQTVNKPRLANVSLKKAGSNLTTSRRANRASDKTTNGAGGILANNQASQETVEVATDFFPIGYNSTPNLQEGGQLVRVELSRAAVARFGLPVNMDRAGERVKADVLVGADGLAQAIRFVH